MSKNVYVRTYVYLFGMMPRFIRATNSPRCACVSVYAITKVEAIETIALHLNALTNIQPMTLFVALQVLQELSRVVKTDGGHGDVASNGSPPGRLLISVPLADLPPQPQPKPHAGMMPDTSCRVHPGGGYTVQTVWLRRCLSSSGLRVSESGS